jgi:esterase/lipase
MLAGFSSCASHCGCTVGICAIPQTAFRAMEFTARPSGRKYPVWRTKQANGPPILVLHEVNGLGYPVLDFCLELERHGWTAYAPQLWGDYGQNKPFSSFDLLADHPDWRLHDTHSAGPVLQHMERLVEWISRQHGGRRVVVMGNCLTGAFPLALLGHAKVRAGILCQPAMPVAPNVCAGLTGWTSREFKRSLAISDDDLNQAVAAMQRDPSKQLTGFHYLEDWMAPIAKFDTIHEALQKRRMTERFRPVVLVLEQDRTHPVWWQVVPTQVPRNLKGPHNTVTAGGSLADRKHLRQILFHWLEPMKTGR